MTKLTSELKRILAGLAYQDAGDYLSMHDKLELLGAGPEAPAQPAARPHGSASGAIAKRVALISDGRGLGAPLDYALETCLRQGAQIDLLVHGAPDPRSIAGLESQVRRRGLTSQRVDLGARIVADIIDYVRSQPSVIFLVAMPDDPAARVLMEEVIPRRKGLIPVPLVLIESPAAAPRYARAVG